MQFYNPYGYYQPQTNQFSQQTNQFSQQPNQLQIPQVQQTQFNNPLPMGISGKYVNSFDEITANDVPMDGRAALFIKGDLSEIEARAWTPNGMINRTVFKPFIEPKVENGTSNAQNAEIGAFGEAIGALQSDVKSLSEKIDSFLKGVSANESDTTHSGNEKPNTVFSKSGK